MPFLVVWTGELHVEESLIAVLLILADMLQGLIVLVPDRTRIVHYEQLCVLGASAYHKMLGPDAAVHEVLEVEVLQYGYYFDAQHEGALDGEFAPALAQELAQIIGQFLEDYEVVVLLLAAPVHVRDADAALHGLQDLALLQDAQLVGGGLLLDLVALHEHVALVLCVHAQVEQVLVLAGDLLLKPEPAHQSHLDGLHNRKWF